VLITIEGLDGAGKNTHAKALIKRLEDTGYTTDLFSFPRYGQTEFSTLISDYLNGRLGTLDQIDPHFAALLFACERLESAPALIESLASRDVVVVDRYVESNAAYQSAKLSPAQRSAFIDWIRKVEYRIFRLPPPDLILFLDVPLNLSERRVMKHGRRAHSTGPDIHERNRAYLERCRDTYKQMMQVDGSRWFNISCVDHESGVRPIAETADRIWDVVSSNISLRRGSKD
jgi:dTMP kinase